MSGFGGYTENQFLSLSHVPACLQPQKLRSSLSPAQALGSGRGGIGAGG